MAKYRKLPVVIDAIQFLGKNAPEVAAFFRGDVQRVNAETLRVYRLPLQQVGMRTEPGSVPSGHPQTYEYICVSETEVLIPTLEGVMTASLGDWIIKGVQGEFYPCKPDIFAATYTLVVTGEGD